MFTKQKVKKISLIAALLVLMICAAILGSVTLADNSTSAAEALPTVEDISTSRATETADMSTKVAGYAAKLSYSADGSTVTGIDINDTETADNKANLAIVIPATNPTDSATPITAIGDSAFSMDMDGNKNFVFTSLDMSRATNLATIGNYAFRGCTGLSGTLTIPGSVTSIRARAFSSCIGFTGTLKIPSSVTSIGDFAFSGCTGFIGGLTITSGVETIGGSAFEYCIGFTGTLTIPGSVTSIGDSAFSDCKGFNGNLTISSGVKTIGDSAFGRCTGFTGSLIIPGSVTSMGDAAFYNCSGFTGDLTILGSVTSIGNNAFGYCSGFAGDLGIPNSVTSIGNSAFSGCSGFTGTLEIPSSVTSIGDFAFSDCSGFKGDLGIPNRVTSIGKSAFYGCTGFTGDLGIPSSVTSIDGYAFGGCTGFTGDLGIPSSVTSIGASAFSDCTALDTIYLPNNKTTTYGTFAFANVTCPIVAATAEQYATYKTTVHNLAGYSNLTYATTVTFNAADGTIVDGTGTEKQSKLYNLPLSYELDTATKIWAQNADYALPTAQRVGYIFKGFTATEGDTVAVSADSKVTAPAYYAIYEVPKFNATFANGSYTITGFSTAYLNSLTIEQKSNIAIVIPATYDDGTNGEFPVTAIGESAFSMDELGNKDFVFTSLDMTGATNLTTIGDKAFNGCAGFTGDLAIPASVTYIGAQAFSGCGGLTGSLTIPNSVTSIGVYAFNGCSGFTGGLIIPSSVTNIGDGVFFGCRGFAGNLTIPNSVTSIGEKAFFECIGFVGNLTIGNSVTSIGADAFYNCRSFTGGLTIPNSVTSIGAEAFNGCSGFTGGLIIPSSVTNIGDDAFRGCSGFNGGLIIPDGVTSIDTEAFYNCSGFTGGLIIPSSVTNIGDDAFSDCSGFNGNLTIGNSVGTIGVYAFYNCSGFTGGLIIPSSVTNIGEAAFSGCTALGTIYLPNNTATTYGTFAFANVTCPIVAATAEQYATYKTTGHNLADYTNLTYVITVTFSAGDGGTIVGGGESALSQDKLYNLPLSYELDAATKIWAQNEFYTVPTAQKANCRFNGFVDDNNAMISPATTVIKQEFTASYAVLESIAATFTQGNTKVYTSTKISDLKALIASGLTVTGTYNDGSTLVIADYTLSLRAGYVFTVGSNSVVVTYNDKTTEITVTVTATVLERIEVTTAPDKAAYTAFDDFDKAGMVVEAHYNYGTVVISDYTIVNGTGLQAGTTTLTISYTYDGVAVTDTISITVAKVQLAKPTLTETEYTYNGDAQTVSLNIFDDDTMNITGNTATNAGSYSAIVSLSDTVNYEWMNGTNENITFEWSIAKANYDLSSIAFEDKTVKENGSAHTLIITGTLPIGLTVNYTGTNGYIVGGVIVAGSYEITATFGVDDAANYNIPEAIVRMLTINIAEIVGETESGEDIVIIGGENGMKPGTTIIITEQPAENYKDSNITAGNKKQTVMQAYQIKLMLGGEEIQPGENITIKLMIRDSLRENDGLRIMHIGADGTVTDMNAVREGDYMVFNTSSLSSVYTIVAPTSVVVPTAEEGFPGWAIAIIVIAAILLLLLLLLLLLFLFRKDKEVGGKEYCVSLCTKIKGVFVKNKKTNDTPQENPEEGQGGTELEMEKPKTDSKNKH